MDKRYVVVLSGDLGSVIAPAFYATEEEATARWLELNSILRDPGLAQVMVMVPLD